ncbi:putative receptor-like protein kinase [Vitis vinifera]|uniref:Putative receptor-like protein kinase n=1 Tax=Vitis vinifera TaxID=29760 RepID=A0A438EPZ5_VITVI|nr:putative receptor-like protein kinase [Vitis vinifera]
MQPTSAPSSFDKSRVVLLSTFHSPFFPMAVYGAAAVLGSLVFLGMQLPLVMGVTVLKPRMELSFVDHLLDCPLDLSGSNFTLVASVCANKVDRGKCCRYINAFIAISVARYANKTSTLGVASNLSDICLHSISETLELYGVPPNATVFCGFGTKIPVNYDCKGRTTVVQMLESPRFSDVADNCKVPLSEESKCKKCLNAGINYLHRLLGAENNMTLSTCRDATFAALASQVDNTSAVDIASCFFGIQGLSISPGWETFLSYDSQVALSSSTCSYLPVLLSVIVDYFLIWKCGLRVFYRAQKGLLTKGEYEDQVSRCSHNLYIETEELNGVSIQKEIRALSWWHAADGHLLVHFSCRKYMVDAFQSCKGEFL